MEITLAHGSGNDFVVIDDRADELDLDAVLVRALCARRTGPGADGVLRIGGGAGDAVVRMDYRNADGSIVEMCGNGLRVIAKYVVDRGLVPHDDGAFVIATHSGDRPVVARRGSDGRVTEVTVDMGEAIWAPADVPFDADGSEALDVPLDVDGDQLTVAAVSMGNPHAVVRVDDVDAAPVTTLGPRVEVHERFPKRTNVGFVEVVDRDHIRLRVWERGVGETAACGSAACAAGAALERLGVTDRAVAVDVPGGRLDVVLRDDGHVLLTGPAVEIVTGTIDDAWLRTATTR
ncbi:MAG: diaminopimelate epimerase [Actinobacteria bacterium]|nr:diaminopimelate epimerase [Actinomycetota bacterium]